MEDNNTINGIPNTNDPCGVGFVILPENVDSEKYKLDVYRTGRISIYGGYGSSNFYNILIDKNVLEEIVFPDVVGKYGTPVFWVNLPDHNEPIVVASFKYDQEPFNFSEFSKKITRVCGSNITDLTMDAKNGKVKLSMNSQDRKSEFEINVNSKNNDSTFKVKVNGQSIYYSSDKTFIVSETSISKVVTNKKGTVVAKVVLSSNSTDNIRYTYQDEFKNKITASKDSINFRADDSKKIDFGDGKEKAVLGETLVGLLEKYDDLFAQMRVNTSFGPSSTRINDAAFKEVKAQFKDILSKLVKLD